MEVSHKLGKILKDSTKRDFVPGLAERLVSVRESKGYKPSEAADTLGISRANLWLYEAGDKTPSLAMLYRLARLYEVNVCELLPAEHLAELEAEPPSKRK